MFEFFKTCGHGLLGIILAPFYVVLLLLYSVYALVLFIISLIRLTICDLRNIFTKKGNFINPFKELPEDILVKQCLANEEAAIQNPVSSNNVQPTVQNVTINYYGTLPPNMNPNQNPNNIMNQMPNGTPIEQQQFQGLSNQNVINQIPEKKERKTSDMIEDDFEGGKF